jgi:hypothetical protein
MHSVAAGDRIEGAPSGTGTDALQEAFPDIAFHGEIASLLSELFEMSRTIGDMAPEKQVEAYETVITRTAHILSWINKNTRLKTHSDRALIEELKAERDDAELRWQKLFQKASALKKENQVLKDRLAKSQQDLKVLARLMLGLTDDANETQIKAAYREKVKRTHPDAGGDADLFKAVTEAMLILVKKQPR